MQLQKQVQDGTFQTLMLFTIDLFECRLDKRLRAKTSGQQTR